jgi:hypothetical protein
VIIGCTRSRYGNAQIAPTKKDNVIKDQAESRQAAWWVLAMVCSIQNYAVQRFLSGLSGVH